MLGDLQSGYDYNALLYKEDLSPWALYGNYVLAGGALLLAYLLFSGKKGGRKRK